MATILNFEAAQQTRDPRYVATLEAVEACEGLIALLSARVPVGAIFEALADVQRAVENIPTATVKSSNRP